MSSYISLDFSDVRSASLATSLKTLTLFFNIIIFLSCFAGRGLGRGRGRGLGRGLGRGRGRGLGRGLRRGPVVSVVD